MIQLVAISTLPDALIISLPHGDYLHAARSSAHSPSFSRAPATRMTKFQTPAPEH